jgi:hypothetical protein
MLGIHVGVILAELPSAGHFILQWNRDEFAATTLA